VLGLCDLWIFPEKAQRARSRRARWKAISKYISRTNLRAGISAAEAQRIALMNSAASEQTPRKFIATGVVFPLLETFFQDLRFSFRSAAKKSRLYRRRPPYPRPWYRRDHGNLQRCIWRVAAPAAYTDSEPDHGGLRVNSKGGWSHLADPNFDDFRDHNRSFQRWRRYNYYVLSVSGGFAALAHDRWHPSSPTFSRSSAFRQSREGFQCRRREERGGPHHSCQRMDTGSSISDLRRTSRSRT